MNLEELSLSEGGGRGRGAVRQISPAAIEIMRRQGQLDAFLGHVPGDQGRGQEDLSQGLTPVDNNELGRGRGRAGNFSGISRDMMNRNSPGRGRLIPIRLTAEMNARYEEDEDLPSNRASGRKSNPSELGSSAFSVDTPAGLPYERPIDDEYSGIGDDVPFKYRMDKPVEMRMHPSIGPMSAVTEWSQWNTSVGCNRDFPYFPPLMQYTEKFSQQLNEWSFMKCIICKSVCPPPPYLCDNGHLLCFSCTSVIKGSVCIIMMPTGEGRGRTAMCGKILEALPNEKFEKLFEPPRAKYHCPFTQFGCKMRKNLLPIVVVSHAQTACPFRYAIKCFVDGCSEGEIRVGYFVNHIVNAHGGKKIDLKQYTNIQSLPIYYDSQKKEESWVPILFTDKKKEVLFPLIMKKTENFVYFWLYNIFERDADVETFQGTILLRSKLTKVDDLVAEGILHDSDMSSGAVIKSGRVLKVNTAIFEQMYVSSYQQKSVVGQKRKDYNLFALRVAIMKANKN